MNGQILIQNNSAFARSANPVAALLNFLEVCDLPGAEALRNTILDDDQFSITIDGVKYTREFCDECGARPGFHDRACSHNAQKKNLKPVKDNTVKNGLWGIADEHGGLIYEAAFIKRDAELIARIHNETGLETFEEVQSEIERRGLLLAPAIGEIVTWNWYRRYAPMYLKVEGCRVIGYSPTRVRIETSCLEEHTVAPEFLERQK